MKSIKNLLGFALFFSTLFLLSVSAASTTEITGITLGQTVNNHKQALLNLNRSDVTKAALEYNINDDTYTAQSTSIDKSTLTFLIDCSVSGEYKLALLHLTFNDNSSITMPVNENTFTITSEYEIINEAVSRLTKVKSANLFNSSDKKIVVIDPGHDSTHAGASRNGLYEENLVLEIAKATYNELKTYHNVEVYMTRTTNACPVNGKSNGDCLLSRATFAKNKNADLFVSIHINSTEASSQTSASGAYIYISNYSKYNSTSKLLSNYILAEYKSRINLPANGVRLNADDGTYGTYDDGKLKDDFSVIRNNVLNGVEPILIEEAFINNPTDKAVLTSSSKLTQMGIANAAGIAKYLGLQKSSVNISGINASVSGSKVSLSPVTTGATDGVHYKYVYNKFNSTTGSYDWTTWGVINDFSSTASLTWSAPSDGQYMIHMDAKGSNGVINSFTTPVTISPDFTYSGVTVPASSYLGDTVTIKPSLSGNTNGATYKYVWSRNNWSEWGVIPANPSAVSVSYKLQKLGSYDFYVDIKAPGGTIITKHASTTVNMPDINYTGISVPANAAIGETITIAPNLNKDIPGLQYKYVWSLNNWSKWGVIKDFSSATSVAHTIQHSGNYDFYVDVKSPNGVITSKYARTVINASGSIGYTKVSLSSANTNVGTTVTITPQVLHPSGVTYKYVWSYNNWEKWGVISNFSSEKYASYQLKHPGKYDFYVDAKTANGSIITQSATINASLGWNVNSITFAPSSVQLGSPITITGSASGASGLKYKFVWSNSNWAHWGVINDFSDNNEVTFIPKQKGINEIYMDVQDAYGNIKTISKTFIVY